MSKTVHRIYIASFIIICAFTVIILSVNGYNYYKAPIEQRFFMQQNNLLKPSGLIGHGLGIFGSFFMIVGVASYMIRKRVKALFKFGYLKYWLEFHIFLCTLGPILILYHTAFKFGGIVVVSFWSMVAVVLSGVIGRFLYVQIPHTIQGQMIGMNELNSLSENLSHQLKDDFAIPEEIFARIQEISSTYRYKRVKFTTGLSLIIKDYIGIKNVLRRLKHELKVAGISKSKRKEILLTAKSKLVVSRRIGMLQTMQKLFGYWHVVHLPFALIMFIIMVIHIAVEIVFGYKWIF
jgi:hypothetical protein